MARRNKYGTRFLSAVNLIILGASTRAAVFSALRAGFTPYWIDQYGDTDLRRACDGAVVAAADYPRGIIDRLQDAPPAPWMYTGAMENHLPVLQAISKQRRLLGNPVAVCQRVRDPGLLWQCLYAHDIPFPALRRQPPPAHESGQWLRKQFHSAGGFGVAYAGAPMARETGCCYQRYVDGDSQSAVFVGNGKNAVLLGVTRQLLGRDGFHALPFVYCGSTGPLPLTAAARAAWMRVGEALTREFGLAGLFGVDAVCRDDAIMPVEVNPRYTASIEVIERAARMTALDWHMAACGNGELPAVEAKKPVHSCGKLYLFARQEFVVRERAMAQITGRDFEIADVPAAGTRIAAGAPIMTLLVGADDENACVTLLRDAAARVSAIIYQ